MIDKNELRKNIEAVIVTLKGPGATEVRQYLTVPDGCPLAAKANNQHIAQDQLAYPQLVLYTEYPESICPINENRVATEAENVSGFIYGHGTMAFMLKAAVSLARAMSPMARAALIGELLNPPPPPKNLNDLFHPPE